MILYPNHAKIPLWVENNLNEFKKILHEINNKSKPENLLIDTIETYILPKGFKITKPLTKSELGSLINKISNTVSEEEFMWYYYLIINAGFILSSQYPSSLDNKAFNIPKEFINKRNSFVKDYNDGKITVVQLDKAFTDLTKEIIKYFENNNISTANIINSGSAGTVDSFRQMVVGLGITINAKKEIIDVIGNSLSEGQTQTEYFNQASHAIQALYAKSADTAIPGYAGRKLSTIMEHIKLSKQLDCGSKNGLTIKVKDDKLLQAIIGKVQMVEPSILNRSGLKEITETDNLIGKTIKLRSPLYCKATDGICETCLNKQYIRALEIGPGTNIGLMSSTFLTGLMTTLTLKKSHTGILLGKKQVNLLEEIDDIYE
jgi:hypothetical protein